MIACVRLSAALFAFALCTGAQAAESTFPNRPVRLIAGSPGSTADLSGRYIAQKLSERWGRQVVVDNRGSAGGIVGGEIVAKAPPDGHTLIVVASGHATNAFLYPSLPYDTFKDFSPISLLAHCPRRSPSWLPRTTPGSRADPLRPVVTGNTRALPSALLRSANSDRRTAACSCRGAVGGWRRVSHRRR